MFLYFSFLDLINSTEYQKDSKQYEDEINNIINDFYNKILNVSIKTGYDKNTVKFLDYYSEDIANVFYQMDMQDALNFLIKYDIENETIYKQYIKWSTIILLFFYGCNSINQNDEIYGCMDNLACNYSPDANIDNGCP